MCLSRQVADSIEVLILVEEDGHQLVRMGCRDSVFKIDEFHCWSLQCSLFVTLWLALPHTLLASITI